MTRRTRTGSALLLVSLIVIGGSLAGWKQAALQNAQAAAALQPEPVEIVTAATAAPHSFQPTTTAIGTVLALRSITLQNELPGTVRRVALSAGQVVEAGTVLVALDVSVEEAELAAFAAEAKLAESVLARTARLRENFAVSEEQLDRAAADRDVALAQIERARAVIERKTIRAPFRARVGIADLHVGQYLNEGSLITTLQGVDDAVHVDFTVEQQIASALRTGDSVQVVTGNGEDDAINAVVVAVDARIDPSTRNAMVRAQISDATLAPAPGASVRVQIAAGRPSAAVAVPASALRKGPAGDHVFVLEHDAAGSSRAHQRTVTVAALDGDAAIIVDGLAAGEQVAAAGSFKLRESVLVAVANGPAIGRGWTALIAGY